jgi:uncharacterized protein (TIGR03083 family)
MTSLVPDKEQSLEQLRDSEQRFCALLRAVDDPSRNAIGKWDIGTVATHVSHIFRMYPSVAYGTPSSVPDHLDLASAWDKLLEEDRERDPLRVADRIQTYTDEFFDAITRADWTGPIMWHGGLRVPAYILPSLLMNETELHGLDIARAENREWAIPRPNANTVLMGLYPLLPHYLDTDQAKGVNATWELKPRGGSPSYMTVSGGRLNVAERPPGNVDCKISADPVAYLTVGYGRRSQWGALFKGEIVAHGRRPWLGFKFAKLFHAP